MTKISVFLASLLLCGTVFASEGGAGMKPAYTNIGDRASLQRGAQLFMNYCASCHSAKYIRYSRIAEDLGFSEAEVAENLNFTGAKYGEPVTVAMSAEQGKTWFGAAPPDLSLTARSRGVDWIYNYLKAFYVDPERPLGWNNTVFPNASMPNVLWELQGVQRPLYGEAEKGGETPVIGLQMAQPGKLKPEEFDRAARDITTFLQYVGEPSALQRQAVGVWVVLYLALFTFIAWLLKREFWSDVH